MSRTGLLAFGALAGVAACAALGLSRFGGPVAHAAEPGSLPPAAEPATHHPNAAAPTRDWRIVRPDSPALPPASQADATAATSPSTAPCPAEMALVGRVCMDRYEAHLLVRGSDGTLGVHPPYSSPDEGWFVAAAKPGVKPQAYIDQLQAAAACEHAGKRLCSAVEWYGACAGEAKTSYPYGERYEAGRCNVGKPHLLSLLHGNNPAGWSYANFNDPALSKQDGFLGLTGEYAGCAGPNGVHDLVGNLHEWVADRVDGTLPKKLPFPAIVARRIGRRAGNGIFMGGFYSTRNEHGEGCQFVTAAHEPRYHDYSTGFRCCQDAAAPTPVSAPNRAQGAEP